MEFDIERNEAATLVIVQSHPSDRPEVLSIPAEEYAAAAQVVAARGRHLQIVSKEPI